MDIIDIIDEIDDIRFKINPDNRIEWIEIIAGRLIINLDAGLQKRGVFINNLFVSSKDLEPIDKQLIKIAQQLFEQQGWAVDDYGEVIGILPPAEFVVAVKNQIALTQIKQDKTLQRKIRKKPRKKSKKSRKKQ